MASLDYPWGGSVYYAPLFVNRRLQMKMQKSVTVGVVLDLAGGNESRMAWGLAFASIGIFGALAPLVRLLGAGAARS